MPEFVSVENVRISLLPATLFQRFAAITIDIVLVLIVLGLSFLVGSSFYTRELEPFIPLFFLFFFFFIFIFIFFSLTLLFDFFIHFWIFNSFVIHTF